MPNRPLRFLLSVPVLLVTLAASAMRGEEAVAGEPPHVGPFIADHITAELVMETKTVQPGSSFLASVKFTLDDHWHIYWENPGEAGLPTTYAWTTPQGWSAGPILWPAPARAEMLGSVSYAYEGTFVLPARITVPADAPEGKTQLVVQPTWLVCREECLQSECPPLAIDVVVARSTPEPTAHQPLFEAAKKLRPQPLSADVAAEVAAVEKALELRLTGKGPWSDAGASLYMFALKEQRAEGKDRKIVEREVVNPNVVQPVRREGDVTVVTLPYPKRRKEAPPRLQGMLVVERAGERLPFAIDLAVKGATLPGEAPVAPPPPVKPPVDPLGAPRDPTPPVEVKEELPPEPDQDSPTPFPLLLFFAFVGGVILNLMPCVLPVLSIKILGFVSQADEDPVRVRRHGYVFAIGVLASFWILAGAIQGFKAAGDEVGWGFQLQYPGTNAVLAALMVAVGLNLFGVFEMGTSVMNLAGGAAGKIHSGGYSSSFWSGMLATAIATPCTAPFMAGAVGYAVTAPAFESFLLFTFLGMGMAAPYVLLTANPRLLKKVPRPGPWMETFKRVLAFPMFAVAAWLVGVVGKQTNVDGVTWMLYGLLVLGVGLWIYGHWGAPERSPMVRRIVGYGVSLLVIGLAVWLIVLACLEEPPAIDDGLDDPADVTVIAAPTGEWEPWSPRLVQRYLKAGYPVFVDYTAEWCQSCKVNERLFIETDAVEEVVKKHQVAMLKADFTRRDKTILKSLRSFKRGGVPMYLVYSPAPGAKPRLLPTQIGPNSVPEALTEAATREGVPIRTASAPPAPNGK